jgi:hypothetical protein
LTDVNHSRDSATECRVCTYLGAIFGLLIAGGITCYRWSSNETDLVLSLDAVQTIVYCGTSLLGTIIALPFFGFAGAAIGYTYGRLIRN